MFGLKGLRLSSGQQGGGAAACFVLLTLALLAPAADAVCPGACPPNCEDTWADSGKAANKRLMNAAFHDYATSGFRACDVKNFKYGIGSWTGASPGAPSLAACKAQCTTSCKLYKWDSDNLTPASKCETNTGTLSGSQVQFTSEAGTYTGPKDCPTRATGLGCAVFNTWFKGDLVKAKIGSITDARKCQEECEKEDLCKMFIHAPSGSIVNQTPADGAAPGNWPGGSEQDCWLIKKKPATADIYTKPVHGLVAGPRCNCECTK